MPTEQRHWPWSLWEDSQELWGKARRVGPRYTLTLAALSITLLHTHRKPACWFLQQEDQERGTQKILAHSKFFLLFFPLPSSRLLLIKSLGGWVWEWARERERHASTHLYLSRQPPSTIGDMLKNSPARCITLLSEDYHWSCGCKAKQVILHRANTHARI